jgi:transcriptional regulator with XRE-family HTH domain
MNWDTEYQKIIDTRIDGNKLDVTFANGDHATVSIQSVLPPNYRTVKVGSMTFSEYEITLVGDTEKVVIPWDRIRVITDEAFAKDMVKQAEENSRLVGLRLKTLREKKNIRSGDLADRAGVTPQTISRIEKGHTDVSFATLRKILAAMGNSLQDLASEEELTEEVRPISKYSDILRNLNRSGLDTAIVNKVLPSKLTERLKDIKDALPDLLVSEIAFHLNRVFGWTELDILKKDQLTFNDSPAQLAYFKTPSKGNINQIKAYSHYAYYIANLVNNINVKDPKIEYPGDLEEFKANYYKRYDSLNLENLINFSWDLGISIIPLNDQGIFHGASWNIKGKHAVVLKQRNQSHARWIFDLLHELYHVFVHLEDDNSSVVEMEELNPYANNETPEETEANAFAIQFVFGHDSEDMVLKSLEKCNYRIDHLKKAVLTIAREANIRPDFLANHMAFRLQSNGQNWWAAASSFQITQPDPFVIARTILSERVSIRSLNSIDKNLLESALN